MMAGAKIPTRRVLVVLGLASVLAQSILIREAMASLGGSELAWGVVLFTWLAGMAAGAAFAVRYGSPEWAGILPAAVLLLAGAGMVLLRAAPALVSSAGGEGIGTIQAGWLWPISVLPAAMVGGMGFTLLAARLSPAGGGATAYALEAAGGFLGGVLFTFLLAPHGAVAALTLGLGLAATASLPPRKLWVVGLVILGGLAAASGPLGGVLARWTWRWAARPGNLAAWAETRQERLELATGEPRALYANGRLLASFPDPWTTGPRAHLLMLLHPAPRRVLLVGGLADGSLLTFLRHPLERLDLVEDDPELPPLLDQWYGPALRRALEDPRLRLHTTDPIRTVRRGGIWDLIVLLDGDPASIRENRTRTKDFFAACRRHLAPGGRIAVSVGVNDTYLSGVAGRLVEIEASTLRSVFGNVRGLPGNRLVLVSGRNVPPELDLLILATRWRSLGLADPVFSPDLLPVLLDSSRRHDLNRFLDRHNAPPNTADLPRAVLPAMALREGRGSGAIVRAVLALGRRTPALLLLLPGMLLGAMLLRLLTGRLPRLETAAVVGASSMTWWLVLAAIWQGVIGSVYTEVGALSAAFMGGLALAALGARRWTAAERRLPMLLAAGAAVSALMAGPVPFKLPRLLIPLLLVTGGAITGAAFPGLSRLVGGDDPRRGGGGGFAADEAGAALAALAVGLLAIPWAGLKATALTIATLDVTAAAMLWLSLRRSCERG